MKNSDIRNFFGLKPVDKKQTQDSQKPSNPSSQQANSRPIESQKESNEKKRKSDKVDEDMKTEHDTKKRLKKIRDLEESNEVQNNSKSSVGKDDKSSGLEYRVTSYEEQAKNKVALGLEKARYTDDTKGEGNLDKWKFSGDSKPKKEVAQSKPAPKPVKEEKKIEVNPADFFAGAYTDYRPNPKKPSPKAVETTPNKGGMDIEEDSDKTEKIEDSDEDDQTPSRSPIPKKNDNGPQKSIGDIAKKYNRNATSKFFNKDSDEEDATPKKPAPKTINRSKTSVADDSEKKPKKEKKTVDPDAIINGPLTGMTIVCTGVLDSIGRDEFKDLLKSLGAVSGKTNILVTGSKLEDGRPIEEGSKYRKAVEKKVLIMTENDFSDYLFEKTGKKLSDGVASSFAALIPNPSPPKKSANPTAQGQKSTGSVGQNQARQPDSTQKKPSGNTGSDLWTTKYSPSNVGEILGNQSYIRDIMQWLKDWDDVVLRGKKKEVKFNPNARKENFASNNVNARACLVSGPPGIGKTTSVRMIAKTMGYELIEQNASDVRNKSAVENHLSHLKDNTLVSFNRALNKNTNKKFVIMMDECDGMSSGDRGGNKVLIDTIKGTKIPIICICNDRMHPKVRSLANHCYDVKFHKPQKQTVAKRIMEICAQEKLRVEPNSIEYLCESFGNDIRQILNFVQMYAKTNSSLSYMAAKNTMSTANKDENVMINNFEASKKIMTQHNLTLRDKLDLFFIDYDLIPLLVQENYLPNSPKSDKNELQRVAFAADLISTGDILNRAIRVNGEWGLMPNFAFLSSIYPSEIMRTFVTFPKFPEWLGKNSSQRKRQREIRELRASMSHAITGSRNAVLFDYAKPLATLINANLQDEGKSAVESVIDIMDYYGLSPDMVKEHLTDIQLDKKDPLLGVSTATKSSLTRTYNTSHKSSLKAKKPKRGAGGGEEGEGHRFNPEAEEDEGPLVEDDEELNLEEGDDTGEDKFEVEGKVLKDGGSKKGKIETGKKSEAGGKKKK